MGVVFSVNVLVPIATGVPVAVNNIVCKPAFTIPEAEKVTPLAVALILYVPADTTVTVIVWVTPVTAVPAVIVPAEAVEQLKFDITALPPDELEEVFINTHLVPSLKYKPGTTSLTLEVL